MLGFTNSSAALSFTFSIGFTFVDPWVLNYKLLLRKYINNFLVGVYWVLNALWISLALGLFDPHLFFVLLLCDIVPCRRYGLSLLAVTNCKKI